MSQITALLSVILLASCGGKETNNEEVKPEIPEALQEKSIDLGRYSKRGGDLTEELYQELVAGSPELKSLENELSAFSSEETQDAFYGYNEKSEHYYGSAKSNTNLIKDSITKNKIIALIRKSNEKYLGKTAELNGLLNDIRDKQNSINDYHTILKIVTTLPVIEKYQNENLPHKTEFEKIILKEDQLIEKTKKATPKY